MSQMEFTMLSTDLRREPRWRLLSNQPTARLIYLSFMTSSLVSYTGYFHLPIPVFEYESMIPGDKLKLGLSALCATGMIEFDEHSEIVRIDGWFNERRTPQNVNCLKASIKSYDRPHLPTDEIMARSISELTLACIKKSRSLKVNRKNPESSLQHRADYAGELFAFLERSLEAVDGLETALRAAFNGSDKRLQGYYDELSYHVPQLGRCRAGGGHPNVVSSQNNPRIQSVEERFPDPSGTVSEQLLNPSETLPERFSNPSETLPVKEEVDQRKRLKTGGHTVAPPLQSTIESVLSKQARGS